MLANSRFWDRDKLAKVWGFSEQEVWSQRVRDNRNGFRSKIAVKKALAYVTDKIDCDDPEALIDYHDSTKGEHRSIIGGSLHPDSTEYPDDKSIEERCGNCGSRALWEIDTTWSIPEGSNEAELWIDGEQIWIGGKFDVGPPPD
jgi:hypothetical protein